MYYTYAYLREDGTPYYIGKGKDRRAFNKRYQGAKLPKDRSRIIFLKQNLTEEEAFKHEIYMISIFGRKDLGTGILHNRTDGGDGASGAVRSLEFKEKLSRANKNKILLKEHKEKLRKANIGKNNPRYGKSPSPETREKMKMAQLGEKHLRSNWWKITHSNGDVTIICGLSTWCKNSGYSNGNIHNVYKGKRKRHKDIMKVEKIK
jgi:hypothetical protein